MKYFIDMYKWGPHKAAVVTPSVSLEISAHESLIEMLNHKAKKSPITQIFHQASPSHKPLYLIPRLQLGGVTFSVHIYDALTNWHSFVSAFTTDPKGVIWDLEAFLVERLLSGEAISRSIPSTAHTSTFERTFSWLTSDGELWERPLVDRRTFFAQAGDIPSAWGCSLGSWRIWAKSSTPYPQLSLWRHGESPITLDVEAHRTDRYLDAIAEFAGKPKSHPLPEEVIGHPAFTVTRRRRINRDVELFERRLLGEHFDWLVVGYGSFARGTTPSEAVMQLGDGRARNSIL